LGHVVAILVGRDSETSFVPSPARAYVVPDLVRSPDPVHDGRALIAVSRLMERLKPDVVHTHQAKAGIIGRLAARSPAIRVHSVHSLTFGPGQGALSPVYLRLERILANRTQFFVSVGEELASRQLEARIGRRAQYRVIRSPIPLAAPLATRSMTKD